MTMLDPTLVAFIKKEEGFAPVAQWDEKQWSNGYGTRAHYPREPISRAEAERRLDIEITAAQAAVDHFHPNLPPGVRKALTDLTYNAGIAWEHATLGEEARAGNWGAVREHLLEYDRAGGRVNSGLEARRRAEASWFQNERTAAADEEPPQELPA